MTEQPITDAEATEAALAAEVEEGNAAPTDVAEMVAVSVEEVAEEEDGQMVDFAIADERPQPEESAQAIAPLVIGRGVVMEAPEPAPLIDRLTDATMAFAAAVQSIEAQRGTHSQNVKARQRAEVVEGGSFTTMRGGLKAGVAAADRLVEVVNEWRTQATS